MKKIASILITIIVFPLLMNAQEGCKVLMKSIDSIYYGGCKKGLANGDGKALGVTDQYNGRFKNGLPNGKGTYIYADGATYNGLWSKGLRQGEGTYTFKIDGVDSVQTGLWAKDKFTGKVIVPPSYNIIYTRNIERVRVYRNGDGNQVEFYVKVISGASGFWNFEVNSSTGIEEIGASRPKYSNCEFPYKTRITFQMLNKTLSNRLDVIVEVEILEPGFWTIEMVI